MILGIDVSTSKIGYCVVDPQQNLKEVSFLKFKDGTLEERAMKFFNGELKRIKYTYNITHTTDSATICYRTLTDVS